MTTKRNFAAALGAGIVAIASPAVAVNLNPNGLGQVLIYPYYTVNAGQQTLLSVVNTSFAGRVLKVRFREAYNGRAVMDFNLYLSPYDVWTANVFALSDAGFSGDLAGIFTTDRSCTDPALTPSGTLGNGSGFASFSHDNYTGPSADTGPEGNSRTREGHIEMILMSDVMADSQLARDIVHVNGKPPDCFAPHLESATGYAPPISDPRTGLPGTHADGGLFGSAAIVDVEQGTFYAYNADALDGFSYKSLYTQPGDAQPTLASVNDRDNPQIATARVFADGESFTAAYPGSAAGSRTLDAVSAVFTVDSVYNEYVVAPNGAIGTDWVLTFPTKHLYVDAQPGGAIKGTSKAGAPFDELFGARFSGASCLTQDSAAYNVFDREEFTFPQGSCGFSGCPPNPGWNSKLCLETNVLAFSYRSVLNSQLVSYSTTLELVAAGGWLRWDMSQSGHQLYPASNGNTFHGLPLTGFAATRFVNGAVAISGGAHALANYTGVTHHRVTTACTNGVDDSCK